MREAIRCGRGVPGLSPVRATPSKGPSGRWLRPMGRNQAPGRTAAPLSAEQGGPDTSGGRLSRASLPEEDFGAPIPSRTRPPLVTVTPAGALLPAGGLPHRPLAPGGARPHHPRPRGPRARRQPALPRGAAPARALLRKRLGADASIAHAGVRRAARPRRRHRQLPPRGPRAGLRADPHRAPGRGVGRLRRLQARAGPDLRALRGGALRHLHHRGHLRPAHLPLGRPARWWPRTSCAGGTATARRAAPRCCSATRWARRSASWPSWRALTDRPGARARRGERAGRAATARRASRMLPTQLVSRDGRRARPSRARWCWRRPARAAARGCAASATHETGFASGWMRVRGNRRRRGLRPRLRALRPRGLAGPAAHGGGDAARAACSSPTATREPLARYLRETRLDAAPARHALRGRGGGLTREGASPTSTTRSTPRPPPTPRWRRWCAYFRDAPPEDAAWALYFLTGRRLKRLLTPKLLRWAGRAS